MNMNIIIMSFSKMPKLQKSKLHDKLCCYLLFYILIKLNGAVELD